ncbi:MAG TPA: CHAT domain-containing protein [Thermoanaerobaculia bacterium]|nr:CHAT domain-containing protein [Thermoanaerobaculia bacterium]
MLVSSPQCIDIAILTLKRLAPTSAEARNDLAAAYYTRAHRDDQPIDFLRSLDAAEQAVAAGPESPEARFNQALAQQALGLSEKAIRSWDVLINSTAADEWVAEATSHRDQLIAVQQRDAIEQWKSSRAELHQALRARDQVRVDRLIAPLPSAAQKWFEETLLPLWADEPSAEMMEDVRILGAALSRRTGDRFPLDVAEALARVTPASREALKQGHTLFAQARAAHAAFQWGEAAANYRKASGLFRRGGSPLHLLADLGEAVAASFEPNGSKLASARLDMLEAEVGARHYSSLLPRIQSNRANAWVDQGRYIEAYAIYERALAEYVRRNDIEGLASIHTRRLGLLRILGQNELAYREWFHARRYERSTANVNDRLLLLGETSATAQALGYPEIALLYQNAALKLSLKELPLREPVVLRWRAAIKLDLGDYAGAERDLAAAVRLTDVLKDEDDRRSLDARLAEIAGQAALRRNDVKEAITAFSKAIVLAANDQYPSFLAGLLTQRAAAYERGHRSAEAEDDLRAALTKLREEETRLLQTRTRGRNEELWTFYFSRFERTYHALIRHLIEQKRPREAFEYAEKARAFEPLNLISRLDSIPHDLRDPAGAGKLPHIQADLAPGTFLLQYAVLDDQTYTWIISHDDFRVLTQHAGREDIERWSEALQTAVKRRNVKEFARSLVVPSAELIDRPLQVIRSMKGGSAADRLVFIPDAAMHGLPLATLRNSLTGRSLVEDFTLSSAGSTTLYRISLALDRALPPEQSVFAVGNPHFDDRLPFAQGLPRLPKAEREAEEIRGIYGPATQTLIGNDATVPAFLELLPRYGIVQFAGHSVVNRGAPYRSVLLLTPSADHTGALEAQELLALLKLDRTRLVVLSSCSSAGGASIGLEGLGPLVRPIVAAGVPGIIGSVWAVDDATAKELMVSFHRAYQQGDDAATALRAAQLELLRSNNAGLKSVFAWGAFQVVGYASSPFASDADEKEKPP